MMQHDDTLPNGASNLKDLLHPYVKQRHETAHIRRVLACHLESGLHSVELDDPCTIPLPLSLVGSSTGFKPAPNGIKGAYKEYLRHARTNIKARKDYDDLCEALQDGTLQDNELITDGQNVLDPLLDMVNQQQKYDILAVSQNYINTLSEKPAASIQHLNPKAVLVNKGSLPQVPPEVLEAQTHHQDKAGLDLRTLVEHLEKSVFRAKLLLKREQKLLSKIRADQNWANYSQVSRLQALGTTRNELISWIEAELSHGGDATSVTENVVGRSEPGQDYLNSELSRIHQQYARYVHSRRSLVTALSANLDTAIQWKAETPSEKHQALDEPNAMTYTSQINLLYLEDILSVANHQKALAQQKSHLTISLAKQLKGTGQVLDRLVDESHLLPAYQAPTPSRREVDSECSFVNHTSAYEQPDFARHARNWTHSSECASTTTKAAILDRLEAGSGAVDNTRHILLEIQQLLGEEASGYQGKSPLAANTVEKDERVDIWASIEGSLGAIKQDQEDTS